jgi:hypothetical protein
MTRINTNAIHRKLSYSMMVLSTLMEPQKIGCSKGETLWNILKKLKVTLGSQFLLSLLLGLNNAVLQTTQETVSKDRKLWDLEQDVVEGGIKKFPDWTCRLECMYLI